MSPPEIAEPTDPAIRAALRTIDDPEVGLNIVDLGLIEAIRLPGDGRVEVDLIVTSPGCPMKAFLEEGIHAVLSALPSVRAVQVRVLEGIRWTPARILDPALLDRPR